MQKKSLNFADMQAYTWFYSLATPLTASEEAALTADFAAFTQQWQSHGTPVNGLIQVKYKRFVIAQANPTTSRPSGCSIDSLKRGIEQILSQHQLPWLDAAYVFFRKDTDEIEAVHFKEIASLVQTGVLKAETTVFDHSLSHSDDLDKWEVPLKQTWIKRHLN
ncbi:MAG: hypothetical protein AAF587_24190 [Bacteroidota bacterium]